MKSAGRLQRHPAHPEELTERAPSAARGRLTARLEALHFIQKSAQFIPQTDITPTRTPQPADRLQSHELGRSDVFRRGSRQANSRQNRAGRSRPPERLRARESDDSRPPRGSDEAGDEHGRAMIRRPPRGCTRRSRRSTRRWPRRCLAQSRISRSRGHRGARITAARPERLGRPHLPAPRLPCLPLLPLRCWNQLLSEQLEQPLDALAVRAEGSVRSVELVHRLVERLMCLD
jgi:hypothetical protein